LLKKEYLMNKISNPASDLIWNRYKQDPQALQSGVKEFFKTYQANTKKLEHHRYDFNTHAFYSYRSNSSLNNEFAQIKIDNDMALTVIREIANTAFKTKTKKDRNLVTRHFRSLLIGKEPTSNNWQEYIGQSRKKEADRFVNLLTKIQKKELKRCDLEIPSPPPKKTQIKMSPKKVVTSEKETVKEKRAEDQAVSTHKKNTQERTHVAEIFHKENDSSGKLVPAEPTLPVKENEEIDSNSPAHKKNPADENLSEEKKKGSLPTFSHRPPEKSRKKSRSKPFFLFRPIVFLFRCFLGLFGFRA